MPANLPLTLEVGGPKRATTPATSTPAGLTETAHSLQSKVLDVRKQELEDSGGPALQLFRGILNEFGSEIAPKNFEDGGNGMLSVDLHGLNYAKLSSTYTRSRSPSKLHLDQGSCYAAPVKVA